MTAQNLEVSGSCVLSDRFLILPQKAPIVSILAGSGVSLTVPRTRLSWQISWHGQTRFTKPQQHQKQRFCGSNTPDRTVQRLSGGTDCPRLTTSCPDGREKHGIGRPLLAERAHGGAGYSSHSGRARCGRQPRHAGVGC